MARRLGVTPVLGAGATEAAVRALHGPLVLHLATHGFFIPNPLRVDDRAQTVNIRLVAVGGSESVPPNVDEWAALEDPMLRCGLALAGANVLFAGLDGDAPDDGLLIGHDIIGIDLEGTELVVASACETGVGDQIGAEGLYGLRRAFTFAGARTTVMSLWSVVTTATTRRLMAAFYDGLLDDLGCAEALQRRGEVGRRCGCRSRRLGRLRLLWRPWPNLTRSAAMLCGVVHGRCTEGEDRCQ